MSKCSAVTIIVSLDKEKAQFLFKTTFPRWEIKRAVSSEQRRIAESINLVTLRFQIVDILVQSPYLRYTFQHPYLCNECVNTPLPTVRLGPNRCVLTGRFPPFIKNIHLIVVLGENWTVLGDI